MGISKEKDRSVILSSPGDFPRRIKSLLLDAAYPAEKFHVTTPEEAKIKFDNDLGIVNCIINGSDYQGGDLDAVLKQLYPVFTARRGSKIMVCLDEEQFNEAENLGKQYPKFSFTDLPLSKPKVNQVFNPINVVEKTFVPKRIQPQQDNQPKKNLNFYETSKHVQDTLESIKALGQNKNDMNAISHIGQRFNGIIGAFSFVEDKPGYAQLANLSRVIDDIARTYEKSPKEVINDSHYNLMLDAAKCSFLLLKNLRDSVPITQKHLDMYEKVKRTYDASSDIDRRNSHSQDDIDAILAEAGIGDAS